jgi:lipopolysaccharide/colanic/teichoic acid biosynthesis glycosyltransferase
LQDGPLGRTIDTALPAGALNGHDAPVEASRNGAPRGRITGRQRSEFARAADRLDFGASAPPRTGARDALYRRVLALGDVFAAAWAVIVGMLVFENTLPEPLLMAALPLVVLASKVSGLYDHDEYLLRRTTLEEVPSLFQAATAYSLLVLVGGELLVSPDIERTSLVGLWGLLFLSLVSARIGLRWLLARFGRVERCLVLGDAAAASRLSRSFAVTGSVRAEVVGRLPLEHRDAEPEGGPALEPIEEVLEQEQIDRVVIASRRSDSELMVDVVRLVKGLGVKVSVLPGLFEAVGSSASVDEVDGLLLLGLRGEGLTRSAQALKRTLDVILAGAMLVLSAPAIAVAAIAAARSEGSLLIRERLRGRDGRSFEMLSFSTDLRRFGLRALPRLVNVLRGDLSLVGPHPRPLGGGPPPLDAESSRDLRPGLTGLWWLRGSAQSPEELPTLDYLYAANWSLWLDVRVLLRTALILAGPTQGPRVRPVAVRPGRANGASPVGNGLPSAGNGNAPKNGNHGRRNGHASANGASTAHANGAAHENGFNGASHSVALDRAPARRRLPARPIRLSAVVPATNEPRTLDVCLAALRGAINGPDEIVVVEDRDIGGPAAARNEGARRASGDVLVFVDADVVIHRDAFSRIRELFERDPGLTAAFGSYDDGMPSYGRVATFRNVLHHHVHHSRPGVANTFWSGLGAVRRRDFLECGGFDPERFPYPSVEDIDLGMRLSARGARIVLNPRIQGTHLKDWQLREMVRTDFSRRGVPWVGLLTRRGAPRSTLNLGWRHRTSAGVAMVGLGAAILRRPGVLAASALALLGLNESFYRLLARRYGLRTTAAAMVLHILHHLISVASVPVGLIARLTEARGRRR